MWLRCAFILSAVAPFAAAAAWPDPNVSYLFSTLKSTSKAVLPVSVSGVAEASGGELLLKFHVTNISSEPLSFGAWELPWGHPNSISYIALTTDGKVLPNAPVLYDLCCDTIANIVITPGMTLNGTYYLKRHLDEKPIPRDADLLIVWAWHVRTGDRGKVDRGIATGVAWLHTPD